MIAMILLALIGVYIGLFVFAGYRNKNPKQRWTWWVILLLPVIYLTWDIPIGYFEFKSACAREGGLKVYKQPEPADTLRLGINGFGHDTAEGLLKTFPSLKVVEVQELGGIGVFRKFTRGAGGVINMLDFDRKQQPDSDSEEATDAAYLIREEEYKQLPFRLGRRRFVLKRPHGEELATWTKFDTAWSVSSNTLLGRAMGNKYCYYELSPEDELVKLFAK